MKFKFENGREATDIITGFTGMIIGRSNYLTGCDLYLLSPKVDKEGKHVEGRWIDEQRVAYVNKKKPLVLKDAEVKDDPGSDIPAPIK